MKRTLSLFILFTLVFTFEFDKKEELESTFKEFIFEEDSGTNFLGNTFTVYSGTMFSEPWLSEKRERGGSASHDRFLDRIEQIEKDYNVKIKNVLCGENLQTTILSITPLSPLFLLWKKETDFKEKMGENILFVSRCLV